jgi:hypothetical protein
MRGLLQAEDINIEIYIGMKLVQLFIITLSQ